MAKRRKYPHVPDIETAGVPRCPLCGTVLDMTIQTDSPWAGGEALMTLTALSAAHVATPHTVTVPKDWK